MRRALRILTAVAILGLLVPAGAHAHVRTAPVVDQASRLDVAMTALHAAPPAPVPMALALGLVAGLLVVLAARHRPRRVAVLGLVALLAVFAVEGAVHSVHHLGERTAMSACAIAAVAGHVTLCVHDGPPVVGPSLTPSGAVADEHSASPAAPGLGSDLARAPPAPIA